MEIHARHISVEGAHGRLLPPTSLRISERRLALVRGGREESTAFALALAGRLSPTRGAVLLDGRADARALRRCVAVVDSPEVSEPEDALPLRAVIAEELAYTGRPPGRTGKVATTEWLRRLGATDYASTRFELVPPTLRSKALLDIAASRTGVRALVLDSPDRHSEDPNDWWPHAIEQARAGLAVIVCCSHSVAGLMGVDSAVIGADDQPEPITVWPGEHAGDDRQTATLLSATEDSP